MSVVCHAVFPAAGIGARVGGDTPKQYLEIDGIALLEHSLRALLGSQRIATVWVPLHPDDDRASSITALQSPRVRLLTGGAERADSVLAGLDLLSQEADEDDWVLVHDAARPCLGKADLERLIDIVIEADCGGILAVPLVDTIKQADSKGRVLATLDRSAVWRAQTPQMFRLGQLRDALRRALRDGLEITDEASAMELAGHPVQLVRGSPSNLKVTVPDDLALAAWYLSQAPAEEL